MPDNVTNTNNPINWPSLDDLGKHVDVVGCSFITDKNTGKTVKICSVEDIVSFLRKAVTVSEAPPTTPAVAPAGPVAHANPD